MARMAVTWLSCIVISLCWSQIAALISTCGQLKPCLTYFEGPCTGTTLNDRQVCLTYTPGGSCTDGDTTNLGGTDGTGTTGKGGACYANDFASFNVAGVGNTITRPWAANTAPLCKVLPGGSTLVYGIRDLYMPTGVSPQTSGYTISGYNAKCEGPEAVCQSGVAKDMKLTFIVTPCTGVAATPAPQNINCNNCPYTEIIPCDQPCGPGMRTLRKTCASAGCSTDIKREACNTKPCVSQTPINGGFTQWTQWTQCTRTCRPDGTKQRTRSCTMPTPRDGGSACSGSSLDIMPCNQTKPCKRKPKKSKAAKKAKKAKKAAKKAKKAKNGKKPKKTKKKGKRGN